MPARMLWRVVDLEQTRPSVVHYYLAWMVTRAIAMFTPAECQALAKEKLVEAERDPQHRKRLQRVAVAWLILANQLIRAEGRAPESCRHSPEQDCRAHLEAPAKCNPELSLHPSVGPRVPPRSLPKPPTL
jgi:hypothetical protein